MQPLGDIGERLAATEQQCARAAAEAGSGPATTVAGTASAGQRRDHGSHVRPGMQAEGQRSQFLDLSPEIGASTIQLRLAQGREPLLECLEPPQRPRAHAPFEAPPLLVPGHEQPPA